MSSITIAILGGVICLLLLAYIVSKEKWDKATRPPKGWMKHNGVFHKLPTINKKDETI